jgi:hypothetical protein
VKQDFGCQSVRSVSVDGICTFLDALDGIKEDLKDGYKDALRLHNISGAVLLTCSLEDLKVVLGMTFGDWEIFKQMVFFLRHRERDSGELKRDDCKRLSFFSMKHVSGLAK